MALPRDPISGGYVLSNPGVRNRWTCPACYADHAGSLSGQQVACDCGATLSLTIDYEPVCRATCVDPLGDDE
ncbi:MAG: hypothetical protein ACOY5R_06710 [Pseudomonadota bacterium]